MPSHLSWNRVFFVRSKLASFIDIDIDGIVTSQDTWSKLRAVGWVAFMINRYKQAWNSLYSQSPTGILANVKRMSEHSLQICMTEYQCVTNCMRTTDFATSKSMPTNQ